MLCRAVSGTVTGVWGMTGKKLTGVGALVVFPAIRVATGSDRELPPSTDLTLLVITPAQQKEVSSL